jgi:SAM-dependent methyltransferase
MAVGSLIAENRRWFDPDTAGRPTHRLPRPADGFAELARILAPGGVVVITVPHLSRIHEAPNDYYRFTRFSLTGQAEQAELEVIEVSEVGAVSSLIGHQLSTAIVVAVWHVALLRWVAFGVATLVITLPAIALDRLHGLKQHLPLNHVLVARKPPETAAP